MKKSLTFTIALLLMMTTFSASAFALNFQAGENVGVEEALTGDTYIAGGNVTVNETVTGDLYVAGGNVTINADVTQDLVIAGGRVTLNGYVADDIRVFGGNVILLGNVEDSVIAGGGTLDIAKQSIIKGDLVLGSGQVSMAGEVRGSVIGGVGVLFLSGNVKGDVKVTTQEKLEILPGAKIGGMLKYSSIVKSDIPDGVVTGEIAFNQLKKNDNLDLKKVTEGYLVYRLMSYLSALIILFILVLLMPMGLVRTGAAIKSNVFKAFGIGAALFIGIFLAAILLLVTIIGIPLAVILLVGFFMAMYFAKFFAAIFLAGLIVNYEKIKKHQKTKLFFGTAVGLLVFYLLQMIPVIGWLFYVLLFFVGLGGIFLMKKDMILFLKEKKKI